MGMRRMYWCDICGDQYETIQSANENLYGVNFANNTTFSIGKFSNTDGKHICKECMRQLRERELPT